MTSHVFSVYRVILADGSHQHLEAAAMLRLRTAEGPAYVFFDHENEPICRIYCSLVHKVHALRQITRETPRVGEEAK